MNAALAHYDAALAYLSRESHINRELLLALHYERLVELHVAMRDGAVVGVLVRGPGPFNFEPTWLRIEASDAQAVHDLMGMIEITPELCLSVHQPWIGALLAQTYGLHHDGSGVYGYLIDQAGVTPAAPSDARLLTRQDRRLVERSACGWNRSYFDHLLLDNRRPWAIVRDGEIVCRASSGYANADSEEVIGVWTHPRWRQRGLAQEIVRAVTADILSRFRFAAYTTTYNNHASQAVAQRVGFQRCFAADTYRPAPS